MRSAALGFLLALALAACGSGAEQVAAPDSTSAQCDRVGLATQSPGRLTVATGGPAYEPWVIADTPESGQGFEPAVAYAAAEWLGLRHDDVTWVRTTFDAAIAPGIKTSDWNIQQLSITADREKAVDFSSAYYEVNQAVVAHRGSPIATATSVSDLGSATLGAALGSTSLDAAQAVIEPDQAVVVFSDNAAAVAALAEGSVDAIVVDLPTAFHVVAEEVPGAVIVGQLRAPDDGAATDRFGILLAAESPLTECTTRAIDALRANGTLAALADRWLGAGAGVQTLK